MKDLRVAFFICATVAALVLWFVERDLPRMNWVDLAPTRPNYETGAVYPVRERGTERYRYYTADQIEARETRVRNGTIAGISIVIVVFGVIPLVMITRRRRATAQRRDGGGPN